MRMAAHVRRAHAQYAAPPDSEVLRRHRAFIHNLPCVICGKPPLSEAAQLRWGADAESERYLLPLCGPETVWEDCCHNRLYYIGPRRFWSALGIGPFPLARRLWAVSGDRQAGEGIVRRTRQAIAQHTGEGSRAIWHRAPASPLPEAGR